MSSFVEKITLKILSHYLDNYINPIQGSQLKMALKTGNAELHNVTIKSTALSMHHLPFTVTSGIIQSIKLHFPWKSLKKQPCIIEIDGIHIIANFSKDITVKSELEIKESVLKDLEEAGLGEEKIKNALFQGTVSQVISNIIIKIKNVHIRVEINTPDPNTCFALGIMCNKLELFSISENGQQTFIQSDSNIAKRIQIQDFSIYADPQPERIDLPTTQEKVEEYLKMRYNEKHSFILDSFSFSTDYFITKHQLQTFSKMANQIDQIYFKFTQKQMAIFGEFLFQYNLFQLRQRYAILGHPRHPPFSEVENEERKLSLQWWRFLHQCTIEKRYPNRLNIQESILILKSRTNYFNIWKIRQSMNPQEFKKSSKYSKLKSIEEKLPLNAILFLRNYSDYRINKEKKDQSKIVIDKSELEMLTNSNAVETCRDISLLINKIKVKIYEEQNDKKPILTFAADELISKYLQPFDKSLNFSLVCKTMKIYSKEKIIFQQDSINRSSIEMNYQYRPNTKEKYADIVASSPFINVDLKFLYKLKAMLYDNGFKKCPSSSYFSFTKKIAEKVTEEANKTTPYMIRKGQYSDMILQKKCDEYPFLKLTMKMYSPTVQIQGIRLSFKMKEINFESFPIHERFADRVESLYINYLLKCTDFTIGLGENEILKPVSIDFILDLIIAPVEWLDKFKISLNISSIAVIFNKESYLEAMSAVDQMLKLTQEFEQKDNDKVLTPINDQSKNNYIDNLNMENLSTNYATKVSILFNNISLELVGVGRFDIVNFETQITAGSNGLGLNLRIQNIICNSLENKYIFFNVNDAVSDDHFLKENNALVAQYTLFFDRAIKLSAFINSPTIIIDLGWLESTLDFFKCSELGFQQQQQPQQPPQPTAANDSDINIMESVMTNSVEFQLIKPTFKVILPAFSKCKDDVELTLNLDYISYGEHEDQSNGKQNMIMKMPTFSFEWKKRLIATIDNFSILFGDSMSFYLDGITVFDMVEDLDIIKIKPILKQDRNNKPLFVVQTENDNYDITIDDFMILFDVNSYMIPELILSLLKSSIFTNIIYSFFDETYSSTPKTEEEKTNPSNETSSYSYKLNMTNINVIFIDKDIKLNSYFTGMFTISPDVNHYYFQDFSLSFSEKNVDFAPIFEKISLEFGFKQDTFVFTLGKINTFVSPSDIIDIKNFVDKVMNLYSNFSHQLDYSQPVEEISESEPTNKICLVNNQIVFELCEDNRTTKVPFPFLRLSINQNAINASLNDAEPSFLLLGFHVEIFNKSTQRWDLMMEPLEIYLSFTDMKHFYFEIKDNVNLIFSHSVLNQICQFQFKKQSVNHQNILPSFFIENNTPETCELIFNDKNNNILIPPQCISALKKNEPFKFMGTVIDPLNFFSPQFISNKYSFSIFSKGKERYISISSPLLLNNKSSIDLIYQEKHSGKTIDIYKKSITPLHKMAAEFGIYGKNPSKSPQAINLFELKDKRSLFIPVNTEDKTYYFYISIKFSNKRGIVMLSLTPKYKIRNNYKLPVLFKVNDTSQKVTIPGKSTEYLNQVDFDSSFNFTILANNHLSQVTRLDLSNNNNAFIPVNFLSNSAFSLRFDNDIITIQPPLMVKNLTDLPIILFDFQNNPIITLPKKNSEDFIGPPDFFKDGKIQLSIQIHGYEKSELFDTEIGRKEMFLKSLSGDLSIPISLLFSIGTTGIIHLKIDYLIYIQNESTERLHFQPIDEQSVVKAENSLNIDPEQTKPVLLGTSKLNFMFDIEKYKEKIQIDLKNTLENRNKFATLFINQFLLQKSNQIILSVDFQTSKTLAGYLIVIKNCVFPQPLVLTNLLGEKNEMEQVDIVVNCGFKSQKIVKPMSTSIISSREVAGQKLTVFCYDREFEVDLTKFTEPTKETIESGQIKIDVYIKLVCLENGSHMIIISNEIENKTNKFNFFSTREISFDFSIPFISINLIDDQMKEIALIGFQNTSIKCEFTKDTVLMDLQVDLFQIDDMYPDTIVPVAVFNSQPPFISMRMIKENSSMIFDLIELKLSPLTFYIDINYIAELFNFFTSIKMKKKDETVDDKNSSNESSIPILIKKIFIDKVSLNISASSQTGRPTSHPFPYEFILDYIPTVSNVNLDRKEFTKTDLSSDNKVLKKMLKDYYNPLLRGIKGLVAARSVAFVIKGISSAFHKMGDSSKIDVSFNQEKGKVIQRSFQSFGKGLLNGVTGVVMKPVNGLKKDGAKGFFVGLGKGVGGIITDPVAGIIDAGAGIIDEVKNSMSESRDSMRYPRVFNNIQIQEYDHVSAICQLQYQRHAKNYCDTFVYFVNGSDKFIGITESCIVFLVPNEQKKDPSKQFSVNKLRKIAEIENAIAKDKTLLIKFNDGFEFQITCQSNEIAEVASKIIVSRSYYNNYSSNSASMTKIASTNLSKSSINVKHDCIIADGFYILKSSNGKYVSNDGDHSALIANKSKIKGCEKFKITNNDDGTVSFLSTKNNKYVQVGKNSKLVASSSTIGQCEKFSVNKIGENMYNFISMKTGQYVSIDKSKLSKIYANKSNDKGWEKFELIRSD